MEEKGNRVNVLVFEDNPKERELIVAALEKENFQVYTADKKEVFWEVLATETIDLIILDIMVGEDMVGIELAETMNRKKLNIPFVFLTSMQSRAVFEKAKGQKPYQYLIKPFNAIELLYSLTLALENHYDQKESLNDEGALLASEYMFVHKKQALVKIRLSDISYVEIHNKYVDLVVDDETFVARTSLKRVQSLLAELNFKQCHRNFLVNMDHVKTMYPKDNTIVLKNDTRIPWSERKKRGFLGGDSVFLA